MPHFRVQASIIATTKASIEIEALDAEGAIEAAKTTDWNEWTISDFGEIEINSDDPDVYLVG